MVADLMSSLAQCFEFAGCLSFVCWSSLKLQRVVGLRTSLAQTGASRPSSDISASVNWWPSTHGVATLLRVQKELGIPIRYQHIMPTSVGAIRCRCVVPLHGISMCAQSHIGFKS